MVRYLWSITIIVLATGVLPANAQIPEGKDTRTAWEAWAGLAQNSPGIIWGAEGGRDVALVAARAAVPLVQSPSMRLSYVVDLVPGAWISMPRPDPRCDPRPGEGCPYHAFEGSDAVWGFGIAPLGLRLQFDAISWARPYLDANTGLLYFSRPIPVDHAGRLNFTADLGAGVLFVMPGNLGLSVGYKFYHISNGGTAMRNPGVDGHMLVIGVRRASR